MTPSVPHNTQQRDTDRVYWRPICQTDPARSPEALPLAGGWCWFDRVERIRRAPADHPDPYEDLPDIVPIEQVPTDVLDRLTAARGPVGGLDLRLPRIMGILNLTPDSFSDGGQFDRPEAALAQARHLAADSDMLDLGGESTRPGAAEVAQAEEIARTAPVIRALRADGIATPISIDTRKATVAAAVLDAGADLVNDVSGFDFDPAMADLVAARAAPVCIMHAQGLPETMQHDPRYGDVLLDVYDALETRLQRAEAAGIDRRRILLDPGIGFGKTQAHNLALLRRIGLFHGLGCGLLLGVSRKRFIGRLGAGAEADLPADARDPGSVALALAAWGQGVQVMRVHDAASHAQALRLWRTVCDPRGAVD